MKDIVSIISPLVKTQFPEFYVTEGPRFVDFVKQYYVWLETQGQATNASRNLFSYRDIDKTSDLFVNHFKNKYLNGFPLTSTANTQTLVKHAVDMYGVKGTSKGIEVTMRALFNQPASVHYPSQDLLKTSDGTWVKPTYLELSISGRTKDFIGKEIVGSRSGAKAFLESLVKKRVSNKNIQVAYLSGVRGDFILNEFITTSANTTLENAPIVIGSMTNLTIVNGGANFKVGDIFDVSSPNGKQGKARITSISNETGKVFFKYVSALQSGGWGYSVAHSNVIVAQKMLQVANVSNANTKVTGFEIFEGISQPLANLAYSTARPNNSIFINGEVIENYYSNGVVAANATIVAHTETNETTGFIVVSPSFGNVATVDVTFTVRETAAQTAFNPLNDVNTTTSFITVHDSVFANADIVIYQIPTVTDTFNSNAGIYSSFITTLQEGGHGFANNDEVVYSVSPGNTVISGLSNNTTYHIVNANTFSLQLSLTGGGDPIVLAASNTGEEGHSLTRNGTALTGLSNNASYFVVQTQTNVNANTSLPNTYSFKVSTTLDGTPISLTTPGLSERGHYFVKSLGRQASFNANSGVANTTEYVTTLAAHNFVNNNVVIYLVDTGNNAITPLSAGAAYVIKNANTTSFQLSETVGSNALNLTAGINETGHIFKKVNESGVITGYVDRTARGTFIGANSTYVGVSDVTTPFVITPYAKIRGAITNSTAVVANVSMGTGAGFRVGLITDTEEVLLTPDFLHSNNTQNVVFSTINLNGNNSGAFLQFSANGTNNESTFNAFSGVSNTTEVITTTVAHSFNNANPIVYSVAPGNTALTGLVVGGTYYVVNTDPGHSSLQLASTVGGAAINVTSGSAESGHYLRLQTGTFAFNGNSGVTNTTSFINTITTHTFVNSTPVVYRVAQGNTAITGLTNNATYFIANTVSNTQFQLSLTRFPIARKINASTGVDGTTDYITPIVNTVSFNSNTGVVNTGNYIVPGTDHNFVNGDIVVYTVAPGNTALTGLTNSFSYFVWGANSTAFQVAATERSANNIPVTSAVTETGHTFTRYHGLINTNIVQYVTSPGNTSISGLTNNQYYYVVNANTTAFQLATDFYYDVPNVKIYNVVNVASGTSEQGHTLTSIVPVVAGVNETGHTLNGAHHDLSTTDGTFGGFGFVKFPLSTMDAVLIDCLRYDSTTIGSIATLVGRSTGQDYNVDPFVTVVDPWVFGYYKHDYLMNIEPLTGAFVVGEQIQQSYASAGIALTVNNFSGTAANGTSMSSVLLNEKIYQSNPDGTDRAYGFVYEGALAGGSGTVKLSGVVGTFVNTSNSSTQLKSLSSGGTANISYVDVTTLTTTARAIVKEVANSSFLKLKRINLENTFAAGNVIIGQVSGATATVLNIDQDFTVPVIGINANITANVQVANAVANTIVVHDSGFGYFNQEEVTLSSPNSDFEITAIVQLVNQGVAEGFYSSTRGFLDSDKKLHDNDYYQEYSYEITSKIPFDKYFDVLKQVMHVAGTKAFGKVEATSTINTPITLPLSVRYAQLEMANGTPNTLFTTSEVVVFSNGTSNSSLQYISPTVLANAIVAGKDIIVVEIPGTNNNFRVGANVFSPNADSYTVSANLAFKQANLTANVTLLYLNSNVNIFTSSNTIAGFNETANNSGQYELTPPVTLSKAVNVYGYGNIHVKTASQIVVPVSNGISANLTGSVTVDATSFTIVGSGTTFTSNFANNDFVYLSDGVSTNHRKIRYVTNNTTLVLYELCDFSNTSVQYRKTKNFSINKLVSMPNNSSVTASANVSDVSANLTHFTYYLDDVKGTFNSSNTVEGFINSTSTAIHTLFTAINTMTVANTENDIVIGSTVTGLSSNTSAKVTQTTVLIER